MAGITWLHLSDWHQRGKDFDRTVVRNKLIDDISDRKHIHPDLAKIDFIIFSGDVAFSGQAEEYQVALKELFTPLLKATGLNKTKLFFVPGNHDLDREELQYVPDTIKQPFTSEKQVKACLEDDKNRDRLMRPFTAYINFVREFNNQKQPAYSSTRKFTIDGKQIVLLGLNSALMCGRNKDSNGEVNDLSYLVIGEPQPYDPLDEMAKAKTKTEICIAVIHHPFEWLSSFDRDLVENLLIQDCHFILSGHLHHPNFNVQHGIAGDCVIIPAGASYDRRVPEDPRYANSYNFVHLDFEMKQGTIYLRRWSEPRREWIEDCDSCKDGAFQFDFPESLRKSLSSSQVASIISTAMNNTGTLSEPAQTPKPKELNHDIPYTFQVKGRLDKKIALITGRIEKVHEADVWVSSENTDMQMARFNERSISSIIRFHGAKKDKFGRVIEDTIAKELEVVTEGKAPVAPTSVFVTGSGELANNPNHVKKIFHVASVRDWHGI